MSDETESGKQPSGIPSWQRKGATEGAAKQPDNKVEMNTSESQVTETSSSSVGAKAIPQYSGPVRQDMVDTAVDSPVSRKTAFLEQKGLSAAEVQQALATAAGGTTSPTSTVAVTHAQPNQIATNAPWTWKDYFIGAVVASSASYGLALAVKQYLVPKFGWPGAATSKQLDELNNSLSTLQEDYAEKSSALQETIATANKATISVADQLQKVARRVERLESAPSSTGTISDIKSDISSIKSLLLNKRQFPAPATTQIGNGASAAAIPKWQRGLLTQPAATAQPAVAAHQPVTAQPLVTAQPPVAAQAHGTTPKTDTEQALSAVSGSSLSQLSAEISGSSAVPPPPTYDTEPPALPAAEASSFSGEMTPAIVESATDLKQDSHAQVERVDMDLDEQVSSNSAPSSNTIQQ